jgi:hypothetical protein
LTTIPIRIATIIGLSAAITGKLWTPNEATAIIIASDIPSPNPIILVRVALKASFTNASDFATYLVNVLPFEVSGPTDKSIEINRHFRLVAA